MALSPYTRQAARAAPYQQSSIKLENQEDCMRKTAVYGLALLLCASAFAAETDSYETKRISIFERRCHDPARRTGREPER